MPPRFPEYIPGVGALIACKKLSHVHMIASWQVPGKIAGNHHHDLLLHPEALHLIGSALSNQFCQSERQRLDSKGDKILLTLDEFKISFPD